MGIIFVLLAALCVALSHVCAKLALREQTSITRFWFERTGAGLFFTLIVFSAMGGFGSAWGDHLHTWVWIVVLCVGLLVPFASNVVYFQGLKRGNLSVVGPLHNTTPLFTIFLALLFLGEPLTLRKSLSLALILTGVFVMVARGCSVSQVIKSGFHLIPITCALGTAMINGMAIVLQQSIIHLLPTQMVLLMQTTVSFILFGFVQCIVASRTTTGDVGKRFSLRDRMWTALSGILAIGVSNLLLLLALKSVSASVVSIILMTNIVFVIALSVVVLREQSSPSDYFGCALILAGSLNVSV